MPVLSIVSSLGVSFCVFEFEHGGGSADLDVGAETQGGDCIEDSLKAYVKLPNLLKQMESESQEGKDHAIHMCTWVSLGSMPDSGHMRIVRDIHLHRPGG